MRTNQSGISEDAAEVTEERRELLGSNTETTRSYTLQQRKGRSTLIAKTTAVLSTVNSGILAEVMVNIFLEKLGVKLSKELAITAFSTLAATESTTTIATVARYAIDAANRGDIDGIKLALAVPAAGCAILGCIAAATGIPIAASTLFTAAGLINFIKASMELHKAYLTGNRYNMASAVTSMFAALGILSTAGVALEGVITKSPELVQQIAAGFGAATSVATLVSSLSATCCLFSSPSQNPQSQPAAPRPVSMRADASSDSVQQADKEQSGRWICCC